MNLHPLPDQDWDEFVTDHARRSGWRGAVVPTVTAVLAVAAFFTLIHFAERDADDASRIERINAELDAADARLQRAAESLCQAELGPGAQALWTHDGDLVCRPAVVVAEVEK